MPKQKPLDLVINEILCKFVSEINATNKEDSVHNEERRDWLINFYGDKFQVLIHSLQVKAAIRFSKINQELSKDNELLKREIKDHISDHIKIVKELQDKVEDLKHGTC